MRYIFYLLLLMTGYCTAQNNIIWDDPIMVTDGSMGYDHPRIGLNRDENPVVIWGNGEDAYFARWEETGFNEPVQIDPAGMSIFTASWAGPDLAAFGDTMYIVFKENPEDVAPVYCIHSYDGGITFSEPVVADGMIGDNISRFPSVTVNDEGQPIVAFMKLDSDFGNARYVVSTSDDFGNSFNMDVLASDFSGGHVCDCCPVGVTANDDYVATLYRDNLDNLRNSWAGISTNGGSMFMNGIQIDQTDWTINACPSSGPDGVIINDSLYSVFMSAGEGDSRVYFSTSSLTTFSSEPDVRLTDEFTALSLQNYPRIANYGNAVAIVWKQNVNTESEIPILFTENITEGLPATYDSVAYLDYYGLENADVAVSSTAVHVVWQDNYNDAVMYRKGSYVEPVGVNEHFTNAEINIFPNPAHDIINILSDVILTHFSVSDLNNKVLLVKNLGSTKNITLQLNEFCAGLYLLELTDSKGNNYFKKIIIN